MVVSLVDNIRAYRTLIGRPHADRIRLTAYRV